MSASTDGTHSRRSANARLVSPWRTGVWCSSCDVVLVSQPSCRVIASAGDTHSRTTPKSPFFSPRTRFVDHFVYSSSGGIVSVSQPSSRISAWTDPSTNAVTQDTLNNTNSSLPSTPFAHFTPRYPFYPTCSSAPSFPRPTSPRCSPGLCPTSAL